MKYMSLPWPLVVAAHYRKWLARTLHSNWRSGSRQTILAPSIQLCSSDPISSLQTQQKKISDSNCTFYNNQQRLNVRHLNPLQYIYYRLSFPKASCTSYLIDHLHLTASVLQILIENDRLITSLYIEKYCEFYKKYTNSCWLSILVFFSVHEIYLNVYSYCS